MTIVRLVGYTDMYGNPKLFYGKVLARRLGKSNILKLAILMLTYCKREQAKPVGEIVEMFFAHNNSVDKHGLYEVFGKFEEIRSRFPHMNFDFSILSEEALLNLYICAAISKDIPEKGNGHEALYGPDFLKLLLLFNDSVLKKYDKAERSAKAYNDRTILRMILAQRFPQNDLVDIDYGKLLYAQTYKLMKLLNFLEATPRYQKLFNYFLNDFNTPSREAFFKALGGAVFFPLNFKKTGINSLVVEEKEQSKLNTEFLDKLAHSSAEIEEGPTDYRFLRDKPLQKLPGEYRVIFDLFLIKKLYNGILFKLFSYVRQDPGLFNGNAQLPGPIRDEFTEAVLLYDTMDAVISKTKTISITGNEFKAQGVQREPDYYCRHGDRIVLVESKDFFMTAEEKLSYDFGIIMNGLSKEGRLKKATLQLATNVVRVLQKKLALDLAYDPKTAIIFPVVVLHDTLYEAPGLNYWVNEWFQEELQKLADGFDLSLVKPVTLVDIDTLILYRPNLERAELDLFDMLQKYQAHVDFLTASDLNYENAITPFSYFAERYANAKGIRVDLSLMQDTYQASGYTDKDKV